MQNVMKNYILLKNVAYVLKSFIFSPPCTELKADLEAQEYLYLYNFPVGGPASI